LCTCLRLQTLLGVRNKHNIILCTCLRLQTLLGDDQYVFTRLNKVFDAMPSTKSLQHKMFPRPPTPFDG